MSEEKRNPFSRKKGEPSAEEMLANIQKAMPFDSDTEKALLSCLIMYPDKFDQLKVGHAAFYHEANRIIFNEIVELNQKREEFDAIILQSRLLQKGLLEKVGGPGALSEITTFTPFHGMFDGYQNILLEKLSDRLVIQKCAEVIHQIQGKNPGEIIDSAGSLKEAINQIETHDLEVDEPNISELVGDVVDEITERAENPGILRGVSTGWKRIDEATGGFYGSRLWVITGQSGDGKSSLSRQFLEEFLLCDAVHNKKKMGYTNKGVIYTYEMAPKKETERMICSIGGISSSTMKSGLFNRSDMESMNVAMKKIKGFDLTIKNVSGKTVEWIVRDIKRRRRKCKPGQKMLAIIDYVQLISTVDRFERRQLEIASITKRLHDVCMTQDIDIILPSQVNDDGDAREADDILNDCDIMIQIEKEEKEDKSKKKQGGYDAYRNQKEEDQSEEEKTGVRKRVLKFRKNRDGDPDVKINAKFLGPYFRFAPDF